MAKYLLTNAKVMVGTTDLSDHAFSLDTPEEAEQVDVSGFSPTRTREFLPGVITQTVTIGFLQDFGSSSVHNTLQPLFASGSAFAFYVQPDATNGTSDTNPIFGGSAALYSYNGLSGELNARGEITATFLPATNTAFAWSTA